MDPPVNPMNIKDHGIKIEKQRVKCNYCGKEISGFYRLKCHLGGIRGDVKPCNIVPDHVKDNMSKLVNKNKAGIIKKASKPHSYANLQRGKRTSSPNTGKGADQKRTKSASCDFNLDMMKEVPLIDFASTSTGELNKETTIHSKVKRDSSTKEALESIGRFCYKSGTNINVPDHSSFQRRSSSIIAQPRIVGALPSYEDQQGWTFEKRLQQMREYVNDIQKSWEVTGCSILLEPWVDDKGKTFMLVLVDCPKGPIYLRSYDLSSCAVDDYVEQNMISKIVEKVGEANVVQILIDSVQPTCIVDVKKSKYEGIFRSSSASYCLELILKQMAESLSIECTLKHAKIIMRFVSQDASIFNRMKDQINGRIDQLSCSRCKFVIPFLILEIMLANRKNLETMIKSYQRSSSTKDGTEVRFLVKGEFFWSDAKMALKIASPIMKILSTLNSSAEPQISYIYEEMDRAKEKIKTNLENEELEEDPESYKDFWKLIDDVWDYHMHNPLHAAAHHLNRFYITNDRSKIDSEIETGFKRTVQCMVQDEDTRNQILHQVYQHYRNSSSCFNNERMISGEENLSPAEWWSLRGDQWPQLANFATRVVSQTCVGASQYGLKKSMAEKELKSRSAMFVKDGLDKNKGETEHESSSNKIVLQQRMIDEAYVYYNLQLHNFKANGGLRVSETEEVDPTNDWIFKNEVNGSKTIFFPSV